MAMNIVNDPQVQSWAKPGDSRENVTVLTRVVYYDGRPDNEADTPSETLSYWSAIEALHDTALGFGSLRGKRSRAPRQKGVDTLIAVDMLVGAFTGIYSVALLVSGDADFVPVVDEVRRRGVQVVVVAEPDSVAQELRFAADRFFPLTLSGPFFPPLEIGTQRWQ